MIRSPPETTRRSILIRVVTRLIIAAYLIEAGLLLTVAPWTVLWRHNAFLTSIPALGGFMGNPFVRGAVTGIGLVTFGAGVRDLASIFFAGRGALAGHPDDDHTP